MQLTKEEEFIQKDAIVYIKKNKNQLIEKFVIQKKPLPLNLLTFFMAGSPGAGKTEFSKRYMQEWTDSFFKKMKQDKKLAKIALDASVRIEEYETLFIRIDVDEIREFLPQYQKTDVKKGIKGNAHVIQKAANKGLDFLRKYCLDNSVSFLHDGTFGNYKTLRDLIKKSLRRDRNVEIFYIYLDPVAAWEFTQERERIEGRNIVKEKFIEQFFNSQKNVDRVKKEFKKEIKVNCVLKNENNEVVKIKFNIEGIEIFLNSEYNKGVLRRFSSEDLLKLC